MEYNEYYATQKKNGRDGRIYEFSLVYPISVAMKSGVFSEEFI